MKRRELLAALGAVGTATTLPTFPRALSKDNRHSNIDGVCEISKNVGIRPQPRQVPRSCEQFV